MQNKHLEFLNGKKLLYIVRSCELVDVGFGEFLIKQSHNGKDIKVASHSVHILAPFRIEKEKSIILGSADLFLPIKEDQKFVDLNEKNSCRFDAFLMNNQDIFSDEYVKKVSMTDSGDLNIDLSTISISIFNVNSSESESWRIIQLDSKNKHLVRYGNGFSLE